MYFNKSTHTHCFWDVNITAKFLFTDSITKSNWVVGIYHFQAPTRVQQTYNSTRKKKQQERK